MKIAFKVLGIFLMLLGVVWFLQGVNILPRSFMTGQTKWAIYGGVSFVVGIGLLVVSGKSNGSPDG